MLCAVSSSLSLGAVAFDGALSTAHGKLLITSSCPSRGKSAGALVAEASVPGSRVSVRYTASDLPRHSPHRIPVLPRAPGLRSLRSLRLRGLAPRIGTGSLAAKLLRSPAPFFVTR